MAHRSAALSFCILFERQPELGCEGLLWLLVFIRTRDPCSHLPKPTSRSSDFHQVDMTSTIRKIFLRGMHHLEPLLWCDPGCARVVAAMVEFVQPGTLGVQVDISRSPAFWEMGQASIGRKGRDFESEVKEEWTWLTIPSAFSKREIKI